MRRSVPPGRAARQVANAGSADTTVPQVLGERLFAAAGQPKQWVSISGGTHSGLQKDAPDLYQATLREFVQIFLADEKRATP